MKVSLDDYSQLNGKIKNVPNHQPGCVRCVQYEMPQNATKMRDHGHLWPYHPVTCDPIIPGHLRPYYPVTCDPIPLITLTPPAFHHTIVSILLLYLNFPPPAFHYNIVSILLLYLNFPPCVPLNHCLLSTFVFKLPSPCVPLNHCLHSTSLFKLPPCLPLYHCLHSISKKKTSPPLRSTIPLSPFYFFI